MCRLVKDLENIGVFENFEFDCRSIGFCFERLTKNAKLSVFWLKISEFNFSYVWTEDCVRFYYSFFEEMSS